MKIASSNVEGADLILSDEAINFVLHLDQLFHKRRDELLANRSKRRLLLSQGGKLDFLNETKHVRESEWKVAPAPHDLLDRRVEITGPTSPKMAINALNSGAKVWLADLEDSNTPHWHNVVEGQWVLYHVARKTLSFTSAEGKEYKLNNGPLATLVVQIGRAHV